MSLVLRILLIVFSILSSVYVFRKIRRAQMNIKDSIVWLVFFAVLILLSFFPRVVMFAANMLGVESPANLVYLVIIFFLIMKVFTLSTRISRSEDKFQSLVQRKAIDDRILEDKLAEQRVLQTEDKDPAVK